MCMHCIIDGWYDDQRPENVMSLAAAVLTKNETEICTGDIYYNSPHTSDQCNSKHNYQCIRLVESEMVKVISTLVFLAENHLSAEELDKTSMKTFLAAFNSIWPHMLEEIDARYHRALTYIDSGD